MVAGRTTKVRVCSRIDDAASTPATRGMHDVLGVLSEGLPKGLGNRVLDQGERDEPLIIVSRGTHKTAPVFGFTCLALRGSRAATEHMRAPHLQA